MKNSTIIYKKFPLLSLSSVILVVSVCDNLTINKQNKRRKKLNQILFKHNVPFLSKRFPRKELLDARWRCRPRRTLSPRHAPPADSTRHNTPCAAAAASPGTGTLQRNTSQQSHQGPVYRHGGLVVKASAS